MEGGGQIEIIRDAGWTGSASLIKVFVDGIFVAKLETYERYEIYLTEGDHVLGALPALNLFGYDSIHETSVSVKKGQVYWFRVGFDSVGVRIQRTASYQ